MGIQPSTIGIQDDKFNGISLENFTINKLTNEDSNIDKSDFFMV